MLDALIKDCSKSEKKLAKENIENVSKILDLQNCIIIFDRGYPGIDLIWYLEKLKIKYIFRLQTKKMYDREKTLMKAEDEWIDLKVNVDRLRKLTDEKVKNELKSQKTLKVRMSKIILDTGEIEYLLSNISENIILPTEMKETEFKTSNTEEVVPAENAEVTIGNTNTSGNIENNTITNNVNNNTTNNVQDNKNSNNNQKDDTIIGSILPKTGKELALKIIPQRLFLE